MEGTKSAFRGLPLSEEQLLLQSFPRGGESGPVAGLDFKSSGIYRKVGSVGSIPMHLRQFYSH